MIGLRFFIVLRFLTIGTYCTLVPLGPVRPVPIRDWFSTGISMDSGCAFAFLSKATVNWSLVKIA